MRDHGRAANTCSMDTGTLRCTLPTIRPAKPSNGITPGRDRPNQSVLNPAPLPVALPEGRQPREMFYKNPSQRASD